MISGFNTDVEFDNVVYHVQTEDKGLKARLIVSLVYDRGTILASKRVSYDDLVGKTFNEKMLAERVQRQHRLICAAVRAGRMNELKQMSTKIAAASSEETPAPSNIVEAAIRPASAEVQTVHSEARTAPRETGLLSSEGSSSSVESPLVKFVAIAEVPQPIPTRPHPENGSSENVLSAVAIPTPDRDLERKADEFGDAPLFEAVSVIEEAEIIPAAAVAIVSELSGTERRQNSKLGVEILGDSKFKGGDRRTVGIMVCRGTDRKVVGGAEIMIKVLGSSFRPLIFHARSDANGLAKVHLQLPHFDAGRAALLVRAMSNGEEIELRRIVAPG